MSHTSSSMEPHSDVKAVWPLETDTKADKAVLASLARSRITTRMFCRSSENTKITVQKFGTGCTNSASILLGDK